MNFNEIQKSFHKKNSEMQDSLKSIDIIIRRYVMVTLNCRKLIAVALSALMIFQNLPLTPAYAALATTDKSAALIPATNNTSSTKAVVDQKNSQPAAGFVVSASPSPTASPSPSAAPVTASLSSNTVTLKNVTVKNPDGSISTFDDLGRLIKVEMPDKSVYAMNWTTQEATYADANEVVKSTWADITQANSLIDDGKITIVSNVKGYLKKEVKNPDGTIQVQLYDNQARLVKVKDPYAGTYTFNWKDLTATLTSKDGLTVSTWMTIYDSTKPHLPELDLASVTIILGIKGKQATTQVTTTAGTYLINWQLKTATLTSRYGLTVTMWADVGYLSSDGCVGISTDDGRDLIGVLSLRGRLFKVFQYDPISGALKKVTIYENRKIKLVTLYIGPKGQELPDRMFEYNADGTTVKLTAVYRYAADGTLLVSTVYRGQVNPGQEATAVKISETRYLGPKGKELPDRTFYFNYAGTTIDSTTLFFYSGNVLAQSITYRGMIIGIPPATALRISMSEYDPRTGALLKKTEYNDNGTIKSITLFTGPKGAELAQTRFDFGIDKGVYGIISVTQFEYTVTGALSKSTLYRTLNRTTDYTLVQKGPIQVVTLFKGPKGVELPDREYAYDFVGTTVKTTKIYSYTTSNILFQTVTYRGMITGVPPVGTLIVSRSEYDPVTGKLIKTDDYDEQGRPIREVLEGKGTYLINWTTLEATFTDMNNVVTTWADITSALHTTNDGRILILTVVLPPLKLEVWGFLKKVVTNPDGSVEIQLYDNQNRLVKDIHSVNGTYLFNWSSLSATLTSKNSVMISTWTNIYDALKTHDPALDLNTDSILQTIKGKLFKVSQYDPTTGALVKVTVYENRKIKSVTWYIGPKGGEVALLVQNFNFSGTVIKTSIVNTYRFGKLTVSTIYRGEVAMLQALNSEVVFIPNAKVSVTLFIGPAGQELRDRIFIYNYADTAVTTTTRYEYNPDGSLRISTLFQGQVNPGSEATARKVSVTLYQGPKGAEKVWKVFNFNVDGKMIKTVQVNEYALDVLAKSALYRVSNVTADPYQVVLGPIVSMTYYDSPAGGERVLLIQNFNFDGTVIQTSTINTYLFDALTMSTTYRGAVTMQQALDSRRTTNPVPIANVKSSTTSFLGNIGEEKPARTFNFDLSGARINTVVVFNYMADTLVMSIEYRAANVTGDITLVQLGSVASKTLYIGPAGSETKDRRFNYNFAGTTIDSTSVYNYSTHMIVTYSPVDPMTGALLTNSVIVSQEPF